MNMSNRFVEYCPVCDDYIDTEFKGDVLTCCQCGAELGFEEPSITKW